MAKENEVKEVKGVNIIPTVLNQADDASALSVTSVAPLPEKVDELPETEEEKTEAPVPSESEEKEEKTSEKTLPEKKLEPKLKDSVQRRIDAITAKFRAAERESAFKDTKIAELEEELRKAKQAVPPANKPKIEDFETEADYLEALAEWKVERKLQEEREKFLRENASEEEKTTIEQVYQELDKKMDKGRKKYEDFDELVLDEDLKISEPMLEAILLSDCAEDVLYYLGGHPDESADIAELESNVRIAYELGKIEERLNAPPPRKKTTNAPEPITPVKTTGVTERNPEMMTPREYREWRERRKR